jgi:hypothetical protein
MPVHEIKKFLPSHKAAHSPSVTPEFTQKRMKLDGVKIYPHQKSVKAQEAMNDKGDAFDTMTDRAESLFISSEDLLAALNFSEQEIDDSKAWLARQRALLQENPNLLTE